MLDAPEYRYIGASVWDAACELQEGDNVAVDYHSKRAMDIKTMEGEVIKVKAANEFCHIMFVRDDGQEVRISDDMGVYSVGSHHPHNGDLTNIAVKSA